MKKMLIGKGLDRLQLSINFKKGALLLNPRTKLPGRATKPKYHLLMEDYSLERKSLLTLMTTSKFKKYWKSGKEGLITRISPIGKTLLLWEDYHEIPVSQLASGVYRSIGFKNDLRALDDAIGRSSLPQDVKERMLRMPPKIKRPKVPKVKRIGLLSPEQVKIMKQKLKESRKTRDN